MTHISSFELKNQLLDKKTKKNDFLLKKCDKRTGKGVVKGKIKNRLKKGYALKV